jgi:hypothetical protein
MRAFPHPHVSLDTRASRVGIMGPFRISVKFLATEFAHWGNGRWRFNASGREAPPLLLRSTVSPDGVRERRRSDGFEGSWLDWVQPHWVGEEEGASAALCEVTPVSLRACTVEDFKFGQRMDKVGSRLGTDDELSC